MTLQRLLHFLEGRVNQFDHIEAAIGKNLGNVFRIVSRILKLAPVVVLGVSDNEGVETRHCKMQLQVLGAFRVGHLMWRSRPFAAAVNRRLLPDQAAMDVISTCHFSPPSTQRDSQAGLQPNGKTQNTRSRSFPAPVPSPLPDHRPL
jgi:hypothetical protein